MFGMVASAETPLWDAYVKTVAEGGEFEGDPDALRQLRHVECGLRRRREEGAAAVRLPHDPHALPPRTAGTRFAHAAFSADRLPGEARTGPRFPSGVAA